MQPSVFISYSSKDNNEIAHIVELLEEAKISYFKAPEMIPAGSNYAREIPKAIAAAKVFLLIVSKDSQQSIWVEKEIDCAINNKVTVLPVQIDESPMSDMFRFYLNNVQTIIYGQDAKKAKKHLIERLHALLQSEEESLQSSQNTRMITSDETARGNQNYDKDRRVRANALDPNEIPVECEYCGGDLREIGAGIYQCKRCRQNSYDSFHKVKNYLGKYGAKSMSEISKATGVPKSSVEYFLRDGRLQLAGMAQSFLKCRICGDSIRSGSLCDKCRIRR